VQQSGPARSDGGVIHWVDLHTGPLTWQIRDQAGLSSVTEVLHRGSRCFPMAHNTTSGDHDAA
jgi:hypothetical protein